MSGPIYHLIARQAILCLPATAVVAIVAALLFARRSGDASPMAKALGALSKPIVGPRDWVCVVAGAAGLLLMLDFNGFARGFPRADDFAFIGDVFQRQPLSRYLMMYHNDHSLPLFRLIVAVTTKAAGANATPEHVAAAFNVMTFCSYLGVLIAGAIMLSELKARRITIIAFCILAWIWPGWGEFTSGFYTLAIYPQTVALGLLAFALLFRGTRTQALRPLVVAVVTAALAAGVDISGVWVIVVFGLTAALLASKNAIPHRHWFIAVLVAAIIATFYYHLRAASHPFTSREFVQNPTGTTVHPGTFSAILHAGWRLPLSVAASIGGLFLAPVTSPAIATIAPRPGVSTTLGLVLQVAEAVIGIGITVCAYRFSRSLDATARLALFVLTSAIVGVVTLILLARSTYAYLPFCFWPTKYQVVPYCCAALAVAICLDRFVDTSSWRTGAVLAGAMVLLWSAVPQWCAERALNLTVPWQPGGRFHNVAVAQARRRDYANLIADVRGLARATSQKHVFIPSGYYGYDAYPFLEVGFDPIYGANYQPADLFAIYPGLDVHVANTAAVPPEYRSATQRIGRLAPVYAPQSPSS